MACRRNPCHAIIFVCNDVLCGKGDGFARNRDDAEDKRVSAANDEARAREIEPKDYSVETVEIPRAEVQMDISFEGDTPQVLSVGAGLPMEE